MLRLGVWMRDYFSFFRRFYLPSSVVAGVIGWVLIHLFISLEVFLSGESHWFQHITDILSQWPGWLIALVFAGMLLPSVSRRSLRQSFSKVGREGLMVWVIVLGQSAVGLMVTWLFVQPFFDVPNSFGMLIETGFAGGHGTAAAMGQVFQNPSIQLQGGRDLGMVVATIGLVYGLASGMIWVNLGVRRGWLKVQGGEAVQKEPPGDMAPLQAGVTPVRSDSLSNESGMKIQGVDNQSPAQHAHKSHRLFGVGCLLIALFLGIAIQASAVQVATWWEHSSQLDEPSAQREIDEVLNQAGFENGEVKNGKVENGQLELQQRLGVTAVVGSFPLFIFTLFGGWMVRKGLTFTGNASLIGTGLIQQITGTAMDLLVFAAITSLRLETVATFFGPLSLLLLAGFIWTAFCLLCLSRYLLPREHWFELGLMNYGMSTGTTATGFVLLRLVDPKLETEAAEDYALAAPLSSPFIGGGMLTIGLPLLVLEKIPIGVAGVTLTTVVVGLVAAGWFWNRRETDE